MADKMKVMSFNLRVEADIDGINHLDHRKGRILEAIHKEKPDLIGFQECRDGTRAWLRDALTDYVLVGCGRYEGYKGEGAPLAFRKDKFEMVAMETFWLSSTPNVPASIYAGSDQSTCPRIATSVTLKPEGYDGTILFVNVHTDHKGSMSRILASAQLLEYMSKKNLPSVLTGDFNALPNSTEIRMLTASKDFPMIDATVNVGETYHAFGTVHETKPEYDGVDVVKIDYIFTNLPTNVDESYALADIPVEGVYISDHCPVVALLAL